jgi:hypothetical protein
MKNARSSQVVAIFGIVFLFAASIIVPSPTLAGEAARSEMGHMLGSYTPKFAEARFTKLGGSVLVNAGIIGEKATSYPRFAMSEEAPKSTRLSTSYVSSRWVKVNIPEELKNVLAGLIVSGSGGSVKIKVEGIKPYNELNGAFGSLGELVVANGRLSTTLLVPHEEVADPSGIGVEIFDFGKKEFVRGEVVAVSGSEVAVEFAGLSTRGVVTKHGVARLSIMTSPGRFINSSLSAWGYDIEVKDADVGKSSPIKAWIYGLPPGERVSFRFSPLSGQRITPLSSDYLVRQVNAGVPVAWIETTIEGVQPLSVEVRREK